MANPRRTSIPGPPFTYDLAADWLEELLDVDQKDPVTLRPIDRIMLRKILQLLREATVQEVTGA